MSMDSLIAACFARACSPPPVGKGGSLSRGVAEKAGRLGLLVHHTPGTTAHLDGKGGAKPTQTERAHAANPSGHTVAKGGGQPDKGTIKANRAEARHAQSEAKTTTRSAGHMKLDKASRAIAAEHGFAMGGANKGKFPIRNARELGSAARLLHFTKIPRELVVAHIRTQAARLGLPVPASLAASAMKSMGGRSLSTKSRSAAAAAGEAMPDGSFPIRNVKELHSAIMQRGRETGSKPALEAYIRRRANALGAKNAMPAHEDFVNHNHTPGRGHPSGGGAAANDPLKTAMTGRGGSGVEHLIKMSAGHPSQRFIMKAHEAFRDSQLKGIHQDNSSEHDHYEGMKALRQAHDMAKMTGKSSLHQSIRRAIEKKDADKPADRFTSVAASAVARES